MSQAVDYIRESSELAQTLEAKTKTDWLADFRKQRLNAFAHSSFPTRKTEHFKYNNLSALTRQSFARLAEADSGDIKLPELAEQLDADRLVLVNGEYDSSLSKLEEQAITFYRDANADQKDFILEQLNKKNDKKNIFSLLNDSLTQDGILIEFNQAQTKPLHIIYVATESAQQKTTFANCLIRVAANCQATVVEHFATNKDATDNSLFNQSTQCVLNDNAHLNHYRLHLEEEHTIHFGELDFWLDAHSQLNSFHVGLGSQIKRLDINVYHQASGSHADLNGVYLSNAQQQIDYHTNVEHRVPHCTTQEIFRGIVGGSSKAVFNGRIHILQDAQKTLAELSNKNLLLSNKAEINTKPELEIYADDVQCAHGATVAKMDETSLFYLQSRGIPKSQAELMLSFGFINELIDGLKHQAVGDYLRPILANLFEQAA
ncbi:Fe-S cluster assembly protein SufD [Pleionea sediminis]|uniref:Fe-S cluster assembly protein SufD n=1 Tax=Pleionea sediminis TaxID=2569479 RepID=UPI0011864CB5|nr:Fe-S cluster assembly protein SufD [Pleionea sediminis]